MKINFYLYLLVMAGVTYLIRMLPMVAVQRSITNKFLVSFLYYIPYAVLGVMTVPAIFYATEYTVSGIVGFLIAVVLAYRGKSLINVAVFSCIAVFLTETIIKYI